MSGSDDRVVSMKFDNEAFERKLSDTIKSLDKLRASLDLAGATRNVNDLTTASKSLDMSHMAAAADGISAKFIAMSTIAITALANITTAAMRAGIDIVKSLTLDPVLQGFREYETNMNSIQTILANTDADGTTLDQVNAALDELNTYSDQTIYNFAEMARNIGTFTAAGVDLETSVGAIKGIANLAAISGSNSQQAATAMYQLSQAISTGTVKLIDWNSVVNAGMGGEVFQRALFESGKAMGTLVGVPMSQTFDEWTAAGNSFRGSLEQGWLTGEVLTNTLQGFTGDLTEAQIMAMGYTQEQAAEMTRLGQIGRAAATEVKTLTQLLGTVKESVASGWSASFRLIVGDFEQAKALFTTINNGIGEIVGASAEARNDILRGWSVFGGRDTLIWGLTNAVQALGQVLVPIKDAFREIFPRMTAERLIEITKKFAEFTEKLKISADTAEGIKSIFRGFFAALEIGWEIVKGIVGLIGSLIGELSGVGSGIFDFAANTGDTLMALNQALVEGGGIRDFFERLGEAIRKPIDFLKEFRDTIVAAFTDVPGSEGVEQMTGRVSDRFESLRNILERLGAAWDWLTDKLRGVVGVLDTIWTHISTWFSELGARIAETFSAGDFDEVVDIFNVGLLGGILVALRRFLNGGLNIDFGGGILEAIQETLGGLTDTLSAMQAQLRSRALMNIAIAVGVLTAAVVVLSMIDSDALARALGAIAVGFGQLLGAMAIMNGLSLGPGIARLSLVAAGMGLLAGAAVILSIAVKNLSSLGWEELAKGLGGVAVALGALVVGVNAIAADTGGMVRAGIAMSAISVALILLSHAVEAFSEMEWESMAQGLVGIAGGLTALTVATNLMPSSGMVSQGAGLILIAGGLRFLVEAVEAFAEISWGEMARGFSGVAAGLGIIAAAMNLMPPGMPLMAIGILILSGALIVMARAVEDMGDIPFGEMAKGIGAFAAMLTILAAAMAVMTGTAAGAGALLVVSGALLVLTHVIQELAKLNIGDLLMALGAMAGVFVVLGAAGLLLGPLVPALLGLGAALALVGLGFVLFGAGAMMVGKAFEALARGGSAGITVLIAAMNEVTHALPGFIAALARGLIDAGIEILEAAPLLLDAVKEMLAHILETVIELVPKIAEALGSIISEGLRLIREKFPELVETGYAVLTALLTGLRDNIGEIVVLVADIVTEFLDSLALEMPRIIDSAYNFVIAVIEGVIAKLGDVSGHLLPKGLELLGGLLAGIVEKGLAVADWFVSLPGNILGWLGDLTSFLLSNGLDLIGGLLRGIVEKAGEVISWFTSLPGNILEWIGNVVSTLLPKGVDVIGGFLSGVIEKAGDVISWFTGLPGNIVGWIGPLVSTLLSAGVDLIFGFFAGILDKIEEVIDWFGSLGELAANWVGDIVDSLYQIGRDVIDGLWDGMKDMWENVTGWLSNLNPANWFNDINPYKGHAVKNLVSTGVAVMTGLSNGMKDGWKDTTKWLSSLNPADAISNDAINAFNDTFNAIVANLGDLDQLTPTITPVLDLSKVQEGAKGLSTMLATPTISPDVSFDRARHISTTTDLENDGNDAPEYDGPREITFNQTINSPTPLSANDIYRNTRSQFAIAKEELSIP